MTPSPSLISGSILCKTFFALFLLFNTYAGDHSMEGYRGTFFYKDFIDLFLERGREGEREGEKH